MKANFFKSPCNFYTKFYTKKFSTLKTYPVLDKSDPEWGNLTDVLNAGGWHHFFTENHKKLNTPVFTFWIKNRPAMSLGHPKYWASLSHLNTRPDHLRGYLIPVVGNKTVNLQNGKERDQRHKAYLNPVFSKENITSVFGKVLEKHVKDALNDWNNYAKTGEKFPVDAKMGTLLVSNIVDILYGKKDLKEEEYLTIADNIKFVLEHLELRSWGKKYDADMDKKILDECANLRNYVAKMIDEWEKRDKSTSGPCFLDSFQVETDAKFKFDNSVTFLIAGIGSTRFLFDMAIYQLAAHPDKQKKLHEELDKNTPGNDVTVDSLRGLKYLRACINETLRLTPSATTSARIDNDNDHHLDDDVVIPKGTAIVSPIGYVFQSQQFWKNPLEFYPERFREHGLVHPMQFNPFGFAGGRVCIGKHLSDTETQLMVATFFKHFKVRLVKEQLPKIQYLSGSIVDEEFYVHLEKRTGNA